MSSSKKKNTYIINQKLAMEMHRLLLQGQLLTREMGGLFPPSWDLAPLQSILDVACGPGEWALAVASEYPDKQVIGIDLDATMTEFARVRALADSIPNARFRVMDATKTLKFPDASFDLVNARLLFGFMPPAKWPALLQECFRILRPGGIVRLTECELALTNAPVFEQVAGKLAEALKRAGQSFSPDGRTIGITPRLKPFLRQAGFTQLQHVAYAIDWSWGAQAHGSTVQDFEIGFGLLKPFLTKTNVLTAEDIEPLSYQLHKEMRSRDFCAIWYYLSAWGVKPPLG
jgi:ubiquinone/menaquinone biosynthesis C-methylase UbiE